MGAPAVEPPNNSTWRSSALAGTTEHMMSAAVTRDEREPQEPSVEQARESSDEWRFVSHLWAVIGVTSHLSELDPGRAWGHAGPVCSSSAN